MNKDVNKDEIKSIYKYYLFDENNQAKVIEVSDLDLIDYVSEKYPDIRKAELNAINSVYLFNALYRSNGELLTNLINLYNADRSRNKLDPKDYRYVALMASDNKAKGYDFLSYKDSKNPNKEKLIPIIYLTDLKGYGGNSEIMPIDLLFPINALKGIFEQKNMLQIDSKFDRNLEHKLYRIVHRKFVNNRSYTDAYTNEHVTDDIEQSMDLVGLLNTVEIAYKYGPSSSLYPNLLAVTAFYERVKRAYAYKNTKYDILNIKLNAYNTALFSMLSDSDLLNLDLIKENFPKKEKESIDIAKEEEKEMSLLNKVNSYDNSYYTREDIDRIESELAKYLSDGINGRSL